MFVNHSPDCGVHAAVIELFVVQLSEEREQDLDASYRVDGAVDGVGNDGLHILRDRKALLVSTGTCTVLYAHTDAQMKINDSLTANRNISALICRCRAKRSLLVFKYSVTANYNGN